MRYSPLPCWRCAKLKKIFNSLTVDKNAAPKSATYHTANRCGQFWEDTLELQIRLNNSL
jgi:hypothetical protein